jgi:hypothetical protein
MCAKASCLPVSTIVLLDFGTDMTEMDYLPYMYII